MWLKMLFTFLAAAIGNGSGAWNIRCIATGRWLAMTIATLIAGTANMTVIRWVVADGWQIVPYLLGTLAGFYIVLWFDKKNNCAIERKRDLKAEMKKLEEVQGIYVGYK